MGKKIQHKRGLKQDLPFLATSEIGFTTDTEETFIGTNNRNIKLLDEKDKIEIESHLEETAYYNEISSERYFDATSSSAYHITYIPHKDLKGNPIKLKHGYQNDIMNSGNGETARSFAIRHGASFVCNASPLNTVTGLIRGIQIQDGTIKQDNVDHVAYTLGVKADNTLKVYPPNVTANQVLSDGCVQALAAHYPMIENGKAVESTLYNVEPNANSPHPRQAIAQFANKDILILTVEGRTSDSKGMAYPDMIRILLARGVQTACCLNGGGQTSSVLRGVLINTPMDGDNKKEALVPDFIYFDRAARNKQDIYAISRDLGDLGKKVSDISVDFGTKISNITSTLSGKANDITLVPNVDNLDNITKTGLYWAKASAKSTPADISWGILHYQAETLAAMQIAFPFNATTHAIKLRRTVADTGTWSAWRDM